MSEEDSGLPEEAAGKLEQSTAVPVEVKGPYKLAKGTRKTIFENVDDLFEYGEEVILDTKRARSLKYKIVIVVDNTDERDLLYPNQPHYWVIEKSAVDPVILLDYPDHGPDIDMIPLYKLMVEYAEQGKRSDKKPTGSIKAGTYKGVDVMLPDPTLDYSRPAIQSATTTGKKTGTTVRTTTTDIDWTAGPTTTSETLPAEVPEKEYTTVVTKGVDEDGFSYTETKRVEVPAGSSRLDTKGETPPPPPEVVAGSGRGNGAAELAQRRADSEVSKTTTASVQTGTEPCVPNIPPVSEGASGAGSTPSKTGATGPDAVIAAARAKAAAPKLIKPPAAGTPASEQARIDQATAPTTVTQPTSSPSSSSSATTNQRPPNVYIYEALTPGFDRYDFNSGKKVYTPNTGPSRNTEAKAVSPESTPRTAPSGGAR
jgi:hypothetical protein|tara:strand:- start:2981 stop:4261 length:1281 start_codon:yes stop_codon:yes gene_type:complete